ncbi:anaerobic ribonucleotide reductase small subunit [Vibrio phage D479]
MNYHKIIKHDFQNGEGCRVTLFVSGCIHACDGCYNKSTWNPKSGSPFTENVLESILDALDFHDGLSLSGGDPMHHRNRDEIHKLCKAVKERYPDKDIWMWSGYRFEDLKDEPVMAYVDVLIDGKYEKDNTSLLPWRGSDNQRLIKVKEL